LYIKENLQIHLDRCFLTASRQHTAVRMFAWNLEQFLESAG